MLAFSNDYYGFIFRATQSVEVFCAYGITATYSAYEHFKKTKGKKRANKVKAIDNAGNIAGESSIVDILNNYWNELSSFFNTYEPWQYKFRLNKILTEINDIVTDGKYMIRNSPKDFAEISQRLEACIALFEECEQHYKKRNSSACCNKQSSPNLSTVVCSIDNSVNNRSIGETFPFHMFVSFRAFLLSIHLFKNFYHLHSHQLRF